MNLDQPLQPTRDRKRRRLLAGFFAAAVASLAIAEEGRFESPTAGFAFTKPSSWVFASLETLQENRETIRLNDAELEKQMKARATPPLALVMRHPEPYPDLNSTFQVGLRPLGALEGQSASEILGVVLPTLEKAFADYKVVAPVSQTTIGGLVAARVGFEYTLETADGGSYPARSDMIVVPRGKFMFFIGMGRKPGDDEAEADLAKMLASIEIEP